MKFASKTGGMAYFLPELRLETGEQVVTFNLLPYDNKGLRQTYRQTMRGDPNSILTGVFPPLRQK
jgi:hypothetical protein